MKWNYKKYEYIWLVYITTKTKLIILFRNSAHHRLRLDERIASWPKNVHSQELCNRLTCRTKLHCGPTPAIFLLRFCPRVLSGWYAHAKPARVHASDQSRTFRVGSTRVPVFDLTQLYYQYSLLQPPTGAAPSTYLYPCHPEQRPKDLVTSCLFISFFYHVFFCEKVTSPDDSRPGVAVCDASSGARFYETFETSLHGIGQTRHIQL